MWLRRLRSGTPLRTQRPDARPSSGDAHRAGPGRRPRLRRQHRVVGVADPGRHVADPRGPRALARPASTKSISAISPYCDAAGQQAAVWFDTRLPSPKTTGLPLTLRIGWTTWACWPTIASIAGDFVSWSRERGLLGRDAVHVLGAPVQVHDHHVGALAARAPGVAQDRARARPVDAPRVRHRLAVRDARVGEEGDLEALHVEHRDAPALGGRARAARVRDARAVERPQRRVDAVLAGVEACGSRRCCRRPSRPS